jgi:hypothetical protein
MTRARRCSPSDSPRSGYGAIELEPFRRVAPNDAGALQTDGASVHRYLGQT